jgi:hypothetical protein
MKGKYVIGVHYRGTDKPSEAPAIKYEVMFKFIQNNYEKDAIFYVATDEINFINAMKFEFGENFVISQDCFRSEDGSPLHQDDRITDRYLLGEQAIIDCWLLSKCNKLIRNSSNLSLISKFLNANMEVVEVHHIVYTRSKHLYKYEWEPDYNFRPVPIS